MKRALFVVFAILTVFAFVQCDEESNPVNNRITGSAADYYPGGDSSEFHYMIDTANAVSGSYENIGTRYSYFSGTTSINGTEYIVQKNETSYGNSPAVKTELNFRRTDAGIYLSVDTTGLAGLIPDTLYEALDINPGDIKLEADNEINIFSYPLVEGKNWTAFRLNIDAGGFDFSLVRVNASYRGTESLNLEGYEGTEAAKIKYTATLSIPNPDDFLNPYEQTFTGFGWYAEGIGLMKLEGNALTLTALNQGNIELADSSRIIRERLFDHQLK